MNIYEQTGRIFDIQRYSIHDGPGIRTIVFLKGCYLRCRWCCNPESQEYKLQELTQGGKTRTVGRDVTVGEVMDEIRRDAVYYSRSGGGVTLSGGECMAQPEFSEALLRAVHEYGYTTAIETTAFASREVVDRLLPHVDYFLLDIKHMDSEKHRQFCGKPNDVILENARYIAQNAKNLVIRVPTVPTFNASAEEIAAIARFADSLPRVGELHLLPYHRLGQDKYAGIGREYTLSHITPPTNEEMEQLAAAARAAAPRLHVQIGG
ncbi:MAG: glycyl-radical enzyme activating protein [Clostridia bacterium]|nr:glycyl-radical enzyme activating protein [Clostridia bacterium]